MVIHPKYVNEGKFIYPEGAGIANILTYERGTRDEQLICIYCGTAGPRDPGVRDSVARAKLIYRPDAQIHQC